VPASFLRIAGAGNELAGVDLERVNAVTVQRFERDPGRCD
jgi:hypothetical protein